MNDEKYFAWIGVFLFAYKESNSLEKEVAPNYMCVYTGIP